MVGVAAPTSEDSLAREAQGGARRYVSRHRMSLSAWSSPTLRPSAEVECTPQSQFRLPITAVQRIGWRSVLRFGSVQPLTCAVSWHSSVDRSGDKNFSRKENV